MAYASRAGRARTSAGSPQAFAVCDRCGIWTNRVNLQFQFEWAGASMYNTQALVCPPCLDIPQEQLRAIVIPADPMPIINRRVEYFTQAETNNRQTYIAPLTDATTGLPIPQGNNRITQTEANRVTQATGEPPGGLNTQPGTDIQVPDDIGGDDPGLPYGYTEVPETGPLYGSS